MTILIVDAVSKKYKNKVVLHPCSFEAKDGDSIVLCGGNGAGKSTLLQIIAGIIRPTTGTTSINAINLKNNRKKYLSNIGFMPDDFSAQDLMSVIEFLQFYGALRNVEKPRIKEVIDLIGLNNQEKELIKNLSKGMRQRILLGQAILSNPAVLLLDEPTNGLDPYWVDQFIEILHLIKKRGTIVIFSTHMMDVAAEVGNTILFVKSGEISNVIHNKGNVNETVIDLLQLHRQ